MNNNIKNICVVLPTYNEVGNIHSILEKIFLNQTMLHGYKLSVLVVDDNSLDNTAEIVKILIPKYSGLNLMSGEKRGLGDAYKRGIDYALKKLKADLIIQMDADGQHDPGLIPKFIGLTNNYDVVIGSRFVALCVARGGMTTLSRWERETDWSPRPGWHTRFPSARCSTLGCRGNVHSFVETECADCLLWRWTSSSPPVTPSSISMLISILAIRSRRRAHSPMLSSRVSSERSSIWEV